MKWIKKGLIFKPDAELPWRKKYALYPSPFYLPEQNCIRIFYGSVDAEFYGHTAYIDVDADNPLAIKHEPKEFVLGPGINGAFDDCGVTPSCAININGRAFLYYSGFFRAYKSPYHIFSGLAIQNKNGIYERHGRVPVLDRTSGEYFYRAGQCVIEDSGIYKTWYTSGVKWDVIDSKMYSNKTMPVYNIRYATSADGISWQVEEKPSLAFDSEEEFGFGRPWVYKAEGTYHMWYTVNRKNSTEGLGYASSPDGINWQRQDHEVGIGTSESGWDSDMLCYPSVIKVKDKTFMFYNGNNRGETGFGLAELEL